MAQSPDSLVVGCSWPSKYFALAAGSIKPGMSPLDETIAFLLRDPSKEVHQQLSRWVTCVKPKLTVGNDPYLRGIEGSNPVSSFDHRAPEAIQCPTDDDVELATDRTSAKVVKHRKALCSALDLAEALPNGPLTLVTEPLESWFLGARILLGGANANVDGD